MTETKNGIPVFYPKNIAEWRRWLKTNHQKERSVWLVLYKKAALKPTLTYSEAVDQALCFGWIDSVVMKRDEESRVQFFTKRKPKGTWSAVNKIKVEQLINANLMTAAGLEIIELAKSNGSWDALNDSDNLVVPEDLQLAFDKNKIAFTHWVKFPPSSKKLILRWISDAKRDETRKNRIAGTIKLAKQNIRANHPRK